MLVLTRRKNESILIGNQIKIKVLKCQKNVTVIGIDAPDHIRISRLPSNDDESCIFRPIRKRSIVGGKSGIK